MITLPNGKICMNEQEAIQWLLDNNALPFQSSANYVANTEIGLGTIVNPSPARVRIGSLIFFADSKVSTVIGITENGFICSDKYNNLVDDIAYVTNVEINNNGYLITTLSDGQTINAGLIKQVASFYVDASQHLIVTYNDGTSADLGAIFQGDITVNNLHVTGNLLLEGNQDIGGALQVVGDIHSNNTVESAKVTADEILEKMSGYEFNKAQAQAGLSLEYIYAGITKTGNKLTFVLAVNFTRTGTISGNYVQLGNFRVPVAVADKIFPTNISGGNFVDFKNITLLEGFNSQNVVNAYCQKSASYLPIEFFKTDINNNTTLNQKYYFRYEVTLLLGDNLAA